MMGCGGFLEVCESGFLGGESVLNGESVVWEWGAVFAGVYF